MILFITTAFPFFAIGGELGGEEWGRRENVFNQWQKSLEDNNIPGVPAFFVNKFHSYWIGIGFLLNSPESFEQDSPFRSLMQVFPLFQAALLVYGKSISSSFVFSYDRDNIWGLSAKVSF